MLNDNCLTTVLQQHRYEFAPVVPFDLNGKNIWHIDLTAANEALHRINLADTEALEAYIFGEMKRKNAIAAVGGYNEERFLYHRSAHFDGIAEPRTVHLGIDVWAAANTPISAPLEGIVHSFANNDNFGDYGYTIILTHQLAGHTFFTLYGHLAAQSFCNLSKGKPIARGEVFACLGAPHENGHWPSHLHFQLITDMCGREGDFPGVCAKSERDRYLRLCPNPAVLLGLQSERTLSQKS